MVEQARSFASIHNELSAMVNGLLKGGKIRNKEGVDSSDDKDYLSHY
jgi:hypothetical protein